MTSLIEDEAKKTNLTLKGLTYKYSLAKKVDSEINTTVMLCVNLSSSFRNGVSEERAHEIIKQMNRPQNYGSLTDTKVKQSVWWRLLKPQTRTEDAKMQTCVIKA